MLKIVSLAILAGCHAQLVQIDGSGTTNPSKFFWKIMETMEARTRKDVRLTYRAVGSSTGQREFTQPSSGTDYSSGLTDFGSGDIPMTLDRYNGLTGAGREMVHLPFCMGAIGVFHSVPAAEVGDSAGLKLPPCVLAKIFDGAITTWDHQEIKDHNPNLNVPAGTLIKVGHRTLGSSSTGGTTGYLNAKCPASWTRGAGSSIAWPASAGFTAVQGSGGMADHIATTPYAIGYLDAGHGHQRDFQEVNLQNEAGTWLTSKDAINAMDANNNNGVAAAGKAAVDAGDIPSSATADWSSVNLYRKAGTNTWPIVLVSYIYLNKDMSSWPVEKVALLKAFVDMVLGEGQDMLPDFSFNRVPAEMNQWSTVWASISKPTGLTEMVLKTSTDAWNGQAENVITSKRNSYSLWKLGELESSMNAMKTRLDSMETHLDEYGIVPLHGSGTTNTKNWFAKAMKLMEERARVPLFLTYRAVGSGTGQKEFVGNAANMYKSYSHFGAGDIPMSSTHYGTLMGQSPPESMVHIPLALGAIAVFHSVPSSEIGGASLKLDACLLAKIFSGKVTTWDHADVKAQNEGISVPAGQKIRVNHRNLGSSSTGGLTGYLQKKCDAQWGLGAGSSITWPALDNFYAVEGSPGMLNGIKDNSYGIGYLDAGHGHDFGLSEVALTNKDGTSQTSKESIAAGGVAAAGTAAANAGTVFPTDPSGDWSSVNLYDMAGANTWPIVLVSYLYVKKDQTATNPKTAAALKAFISMVVNDRDGMAAEFGFTPPSNSLKAVSLSAAGSIMYPAGMQSFTEETSTQPYLGMATNVISMKRHSYDLYDTSVMQDAISKLRTELAAKGGMEGTKEKYNDTLPVAMSVVALVMSLIGACMACVAFYFVRAAQPGLAPTASGTIIGLTDPSRSKVEEKHAAEVAAEDLKI
ncbi:Phosphate-binding protein PstS (PBP) [Durusdinium trenchii]